MKVDKVIEPSVPDYEAPSRLSLLGYSDIHPPYTKEGRIPGVTYATGTK